jgi:hypothetical protein
MPALDFLINEPLAFVLLAILLALVPPLLMYLYLSHQVLSLLALLVQITCFTAANPRAAPHLS